MEKPIPKVEISLSDTAKQALLAEGIDPDSYVEITQKRAQSRIKRSVEFFKKKNLPPSNLKKPDDPSAIAETAKWTSGIGYDTTTATEAQLTKTRSVIDVFTNLFKAKEITYKITSDDQDDSSTLQNSLGTPSSTAETVEPNQT